MTAFARSRIPVRGSRPRCSGTFRVGSIRGIAIRVHTSWLLAVAFVTWSLATALYPEISRGWGATTYWLLALLSTVLLFGSVLLHELSHCVVAQARGLQVDNITLFVLGGVSNIRTEAERPWDELLVAIVGPLTSLLIGGLCAAAVHLVPGIPLQATAVLTYLWLVNVLLGLFNLVPGFPLDGGRVLRAVIWGLTSSPGRATALASSCGRGAGLLLLAWGAYQLVIGNALGAVWIILTGWFLDRAAAAAGRQALATVPYEARLPAPSHDPHADGLPRQAPGAAAAAGVTIVEEPSEPGDLGAEAAPRCCNAHATTRPRRGAEAAWWQDGGTACG